MQPPSRINPEVSASLDRIILKCTQKKPERRYQNAYELIADLRHALVDPNDDFLKKEPEFEENSPTVVRGAEELNRPDGGTEKSKSGTDDGTSGSE